MKVLFDPRLTERLIDAVKQCPALYDPAHGDFKDAAVRSDLWTRITLQLGYETGDEHIIKTRWKNMRDSFIKYKRINSDPFNGATVKNYKNWPWAPYMEFVDGCYEDPSHRRRRRRREPHAAAPAAATVPAAGDDDDASRDGDERDSSARHSDEDEQLDVKIPPRLLRRRCRRPPPLPPPPPPPATLRARRRRLHRADSVELLFQSYAQTVRTFGVKRRALLKMQISSLIAQAEIEQMEEEEARCAGGDVCRDPLLHELDDGGDGGERTE